jgi:hypothetical protein
METIREPTLRELAGTASITSVKVIGRAGGYGIVIWCGEAARALASSRGTLRLFTLDNAARYLRSVGLAQFEVDAASYEPGRMRKARPDRAEALRRTRTTPRQTNLI